MAETVTLNVQKRDARRNIGTGTRAVRRLRAAGRVPAIVYGHKQDPLPISLAHDDAWVLIKRATHLAQLQIDGETEMVLVRDVQWDHLGKEIIHLDFARVSAEESIETEVRLEMRGTAPGVAAGGILEQLVHTLAVKCRANAIPDSIRVDISHVELNQSLHLRDLTAPAGVEFMGDADLLLLHVVPPRIAAAEAAPVEAEAVTEPELIGRKPEDKEKEEKPEKEKK